MMEKFLIDSNSFIVPYRQFYAFDIVPTYWTELAQEAVSGRIILLDIVKKEIDRGRDDLSKWLDKQKNFVSCHHVSEQIVGKWQEVLQYVQDSAFYSEKALRLWADANVADPWLIAVAAVKGYTIITFEAKSGGLSEKNPSGKAQIPDVAKHFGVKAEDLYYMMRQLKIQI